MADQHHGQIPTGLPVPTSSAQQQQQQQMAQALAAQQAAAAALYEPSQLQAQTNLHHQHLQMINQFWADQLIQIENSQIDFKEHSLPLARIKKVMKTDEDVRNKMMISGEAPVIFAKACEIFILELTMRAWIHTEENKRRTLQRSDIATAISKSEVFDFLIDIVPRDEMSKQASAKRAEEARSLMAPEYAALSGQQYFPYADPNMAYQQLQQMQYARMLQQGQISVQSAAPQAIEGNTSQASIDQAGQSEQDSAGDQDDA